MWNELLNPLKSVCQKTVSVVIRNRGGGPRPYRNRNGRVIIHASMKSENDPNVDLKQLELVFPVIKDTTNVTKSGWSSPPTSRPDLPFFVERTLVGSSIPVYTEYKGGRTKILTILRKIGGDIGVLKEEMMKVCDGTEIQVRPGKLVVAGNYSMRLKKWLIGLGF